MLTLNPKLERKQNEPVKVSKRNTAFQNIKKILSRTEDEKHEVDIKILQFEKVHEMLGELKEEMLKNEEERERGMEIEEEGKGQPSLEQKAEKIEIEEQSAEKSKSGEEMHSKEDLQVKIQEIYKKYFKKKNGRNK